MTQSNHQPYFIKDQPHQTNFQSKVQKSFDLTTEQFKKYTIIEADRKKQKIYFGNNDHQSSHGKKEIQYKNQEYVNDNFKHKNRRNKQKHQQKLVNLFQQKKSSQNSYANNNVITIIQSDQEQQNKSRDPHKEPYLLKQEDNILPKKTNRSVSLKAYLDKKFREKDQQILFLPKIGKTESIVNIIKDEMKQQSKDKSQGYQLRERKKKSSTIDVNVTIDQHRAIYQYNRQFGDLEKSRKHTEQKQHAVSQDRHIYKQSSTNIIQSLLPSTKNLNLISQPHSPSTKGKIQLFGSKFQPITRKSQHKLNPLQQPRHQRSIVMNLLSSELIYNNPKSNVNKNVYQQLIKRVFSSS